MTTDGVIRVVIVDDHPLVRQGLEAVLGSVADVAVVGQAADGRAAIDVVADAQPDVVLMDLQLPQLSGLDATREILAGRPETAVLVLTMFEDDATVHAAIAAGAVGYLLKGADGEDILAACVPPRPGRPCSARRSPSGCGRSLRIGRPGPRVPRAHRPGTADPRQTRCRPLERRDRPRPLSLAQDRGQQRLRHLDQAEPVRTRPGHRPRSRCRARTVPIARAHSACNDRERPLRRSNDLRAMADDS